MYLYIYIRIFTVIFLVVIEILSGVSHPDTTYSTWMCHDKITVSELVGFGVVLRTRKFYTYLEDLSIMPYTTQIIRALQLNGSERAKCTFRCLEK